MNKQPAEAFVNHLPDLMTWDDYAVAHQRKVVRIRVTVTAEGVEVLGDSPYPHLLEELLAALGPEAIEQMLCG
jgi:FtsH ternary system-associated peptide